MAQGQDSKESLWKTRAFRVWAILGACGIIGVIIFVCQIIWQAVAVIIVTIIAVFLLHGAVDRMERRGIPRWAGTTISFAVVTAVLIGCVVALIPAITSQLSSFVNSVPAYTAQIQDFVSGLSQNLTFVDSATINSALQDFATFVRQQAGALTSTLANGLIGGLVGVGNVFLVAFISFICAFWLLLDLPTITRELMQVIDEDYHDDVEIITNAFSVAVYGWAKSTLLCAIITGVASWLAFFILGIPYSAVLGFLCGILYFIPYIGPMISCAVVALIALIESPIICIVSIVVNVVINNVIGNIISPRLMKSSVNVYPALILIAILIGSALGGIPGMLLSIPVIGAAQGVFVTYFEARTGKTLSTENGALFQLQKEKKLPKIDLETGKFHKVD